MMKRILAPILLLTLLFPSIAMGETMDDLVYRDGIHYKKYTDVPFTGKVTGNYQGSFRNGRKHGPWVEYGKFVQLLSKGTYKNGKRDGPWIKYWDNGQLSSKGTYKDGKLDGPWVGYYDNGQLRYKGTYKDDKRDRPWVGYKKDGTVNDEYTGTYKNGVKVK
jgi:antitoxin component YwqK of YwqJK toxin-antitoxin module